MDCLAWLCILCVLYRGGHGKCHMTLQLHDHEVCETALCVKISTAISTIKTYVSYLVLSVNQLFGFMYRPHQFLDLAHFLIV